MNGPPPQDQPKLPNGEDAPTGEKAHVLRRFSPRPGSQRPVGFEALQRDLMDARKGVVSVADTDKVVGELIDAGFLNEVPHPGPSIRAPVVYKELPGVPQFKDIYAIGDPQPGERCFAATPLGRKAACLGASLAFGVGGPWMLGNARTVDQVILCFRPPHSSGFEEIDGTCACASTEAVRDAISVAARQGLLTEEKDDRFKLTLDGEGMLFKLRAEMQALQASHLAATLSVPREPSLTETLVASLAFLSNPSRRSIIERDLRELGRVMGIEAHKSALLLCGSILEGVLVDVLDRNPGIAGSFMKGNQRWPDDASLEKLIEVASKTRLTCTPPRGLLTPTIRAYAESLTEHRDLIHPQAEIRESIKVDSVTVDAMFNLLRVVIRDLAAADTDGLLDLYANGGTA